MMEYPIDVSLILFWQYILKRKTNNAVSFDHTPFLTCGHMWFMVPPLYSLNLSMCSRTASHISICSRCTKRKKVDCHEWWNSELHLWRGDSHGFIISRLFNKNQALCLNSDSAGWMSAIQYISRAYRAKYLHKFYKTLDRRPLFVSIFLLVLTYYITVVYEIKLGANCSNPISPFWLREAFFDC